MRLNTFIKYNQTCDILEMDASVSPAVWVQGPTINVNTRPNDRMGFIIMEHPEYFREDRFRFVNFRNTNGEVLYPYPGEEEGRIYETFSVDARMDAWGIIQFFSYMLKAVDG